MADNIKYRFIQNVGDYFPSGYFSEDFIDKVKKASGLSSEEFSALCRPFVALRQTYEAYKNYIINTNPRIKDAIRHTHDFHTALLNILGYSTENPYEQFYSINEEEGAVVPVRHILKRGGRTSMLIMEMQHLIKTDENEPAGLFEQRYNVSVDGKMTEQTVKHQRFYTGQWSEVFTLPDGLHVSPAVINKAIDALFLLSPERRPHYILMLAGNTVFLLDAEKWNRGAYLQFSLDELYSQASISAFRDYYALFHTMVCKQTLAADSETVLMERLVEDSYKSAYEVTKDLKEGVEHSVEMLANEALYYWKRNDNLPVADYTDDTFENEVKDDCIQIVYRLLFIFYAESRDELKILPTDDEVYNQGYSLEKLRDLEKVPLLSQSTRDGYFIHESLSRLFKLLSTGYKQNIEEGDKSFSVRHIDSPLFDDRRLHHLGGVKFRNVAWQEIIRSLSLSHRERQVGRISYANLGINQLGSVYESLLAYRGFYAEEDYIEVHKAGQPADGTFLVPYSRMDDFEPDEILQDENGNPVILKEGTFVYRLNGRDRQKSASYYTPEILTRSTVKYTLKSILDDVRDGKRKATDLLDLKILEPAMGAAAFQNEVVNQIAEAYLTFRQEEKRQEGSGNWRISPDKYRDELQKVKAYIATHNVYGVDLNPTAIELGKLSLWLNVIHKDMETPFFSNRLALGNAVIGAWLKVYSRDEVLAKPEAGRSRKLVPNEWWTRSPHKVSFRTKGVNRSVNEVYHFLLPDKAMLAVRTIREQKAAHPTETRRMNNLIKDWTAPIGLEQFAILQRISGKIDVLLKEYYQFQLSIETLTQNKMAVWGVPGNPVIDFDSYAEKERLNDVRYRHDNAYYRLKMVMDYWCSLWFWEYDDTADLPTRADYWHDIEAMLDVSDDKLDYRTARALGKQPIARDRNGKPALFAEPHSGNLFEQQTVSESESVNYDTQRTDEESEIVRLTKEQILTEVHGVRTTLFDNSHRYKIVKRLSDRYHFFHPMLEFLEVFWLRDGFDIICGNPPWIKLQFDEIGIMSEKYPEVAIRKISAPDARRKRDELFENNPQLERIYRDEETDNACSGAFLNAYQNYPLLVGQQTNLYKCILGNGLELINDVGFMGLLTPESIYDDPKGQPLRKVLYQRLCYHFQYQNELSLFAEVHHETKYGEQIFGPFKSDICFESIHNLFHPNTVDGCFTHDGHGICGGIKDNNGDWNTTAHRDRIVLIGEEELKILSETFEDGTTEDCAKLVSMHSRIIVDVLNKISSYPYRLKDLDCVISNCFHETGAVDNGLIRRNTCIPNISNYEMIYNGPSFYVGNPLYKTPREKCVLNSDYDNIDLTNKAEVIQRTNYTPCLSTEEYLKQVQGFIIGQDAEGHPIYDSFIDYYKVTMRCMLSQAGERTLICAVLPRRTAHIHAVISVAFRDRNHCVDMAALMSSLPIDFFTKTIGIGQIGKDMLSKYPAGFEGLYQSSMRSRVLLLNCLTSAYTDLWEEMWRNSFVSETWSINDKRLKSFHTLHRNWSWDIPLRNYFERRQALVEIDVIAAMALGLSLQDLEMIYTIQFPVLQQNENDTWYDANGNIVFTCSKGLTGVGLVRKGNTRQGIIGWEDIRGEEIVDENGVVMGYKGTAPTHVHTIDPAKSELYGGQQITYVAPYTRCDRIADYRRAWAHFEKILKN